MIRQRNMVILCYKEHKGFVAFVFFADHNI